MTFAGQRIVLYLTLGYFVIELVGGVYYNSLALVTDASFMAINITGQIMALFVGKIAQRRADKQNTFGYERAKVLSGLFNGILVGFLLFYVLVQAYGRLLRPEPLEAEKVFVIAVIGLGVNAYGLHRLRRHYSDMNVRGVMLLVLNDLAGSVGVVISCVIIKYTHLYFVDALTGVLVGSLTAYPTFLLVRESIHILMEGNPAKIGIDDVDHFLRSNFSGIVAVKDVHIWGLSAERIILAVRIRTDGNIYHRDEIKQMKALLRQHFGFSDVFMEAYEEKHPALRNPIRMPGSGGE